MKATNIRKKTFSIRNVRSAHAIWLKAVWWLTQMMPMFTNVTA